MAELLLSLYYKVPALSLLLSALSLCFRCRRVRLGSCYYDIIYCLFQVYYCLLYVMFFVLGVWGWVLVIMII